MKHNLTKHPLYITYRGMIARCYRKEEVSYKNYGGRGINVCDRWINSVSLFIKDMGVKPTPSHTLDRINNDLGYSPLNCRWATRRDQNLNSRKRGINNHLFEIHGTVNMYINYSCRCEECKKAVSDYRKKHRENKLK